MNPHTRNLSWLVRQPAFFFARKCVYKSVCLNYRK